MYDWNIDKNQEVFEEIFANSHLKNFEITKGYFPDFDVKCADTGQTYEIKRDTWYDHNGNILIEEFFNLEKKIKGWIHYTKADFYVVFYTDADYYIVSMSEVKEKYFNKEKYAINWICKDIYQKEGFHTRNWVTKLFGNFMAEFFTIEKIKKKCPEKTLEWM